MRRPILCVLPLLLLVACGDTNDDATDRPGEIVKVRTMRGVSVRLALHAEDRAAGRAAAAKALAEIDRLLGLLDPDDAESELGGIAETPLGNAVELGRDAWDALSLAMDFARRTRSAYDPTRGPLQEIWDAARARGAFPSQTDLDLARTRSGYFQVILQPPTRSVRLKVQGMRLDLGLVAHGFAAQAGWSVLAAAGLPRCLLQVGATAVAGQPFPGTEGWDLEMPDGPRLRLSDIAVAAAGRAVADVEIDGRRYAQAVDPQSGRGLIDPARAVVAAPDAPSAAAYAEALTVLPREAGVQQAAATENVEAWILHADGAAETTPGFTTRLAPAR